MKWIKASERLPESGNLYFVKMLLTGDEDHEWFPATCNFYKEWEYTDDTYNVIEWLDETPPSNDIATEQLTPSMIIESLRNSFFKETGLDVAYNIGKYSDWLGNKILDYRPLPANDIVGEGKAEDKFQSGVNDWMQICFGTEITADVIERNHRFFEEATELVQSTGMTKSECMQLVDYVFDRPIGELTQETGGVMVTLAALCNAVSISMIDCGEVELTRINGKIEQIRAKQAAKPKHSPLPSSTPPVKVDEGKAGVLQGVLEELAQVHNLLAKSPLTHPKYQPISGLMVSIKTKLFDLYTASQNQSSNK